MSSSPDPTPEVRVENAKRMIDDICRSHGVEIVTQIEFEPTRVGDRAIMTARWAVAARRNWSPPT